MATAIIGAGPLLLKNSKCILNSLSQRLHRQRTLKEHRYACGFLSCNRAKLCAIQLKILTEMSLVKIEP